MSTLLNADHVQRQLSLTAEQKKLPAPVLASSLEDGLCRTRLEFREHNGRRCLTGTVWQPIEVGQPVVIQKDHRGDWYLVAAAVKDEPWRLPPDAPGATFEEIEAGKSPRGSWTAKTLAGWGVCWPPPKGWKQQLMRRARERAS